MNGLLMHKSKVKFGKLPSHVEREPTRAENPFFGRNLPKLPKNVFSAVEEERLIVLAEVTRAMYENNAQKLLSSENVQFHACCVHWLP